MSEIVITGATGAVGQHAVPALLAAGHAVTATVRGDASAARAEALGARAVVADVYDEPALTAAFAGADAVVNLLTRIPPAERMGDPDAWAENERLRREASSVIARAAQAAGAARFVQESLAFMYADGGDAWLDADSPLDADGPTESAAVAEANVRAAFGGDIVVLRFGLFIGRDGLTRANIEAARAGLSPSAGPREAYRATVWIEDAARAVVAALTVPAGVYDVVDDDPATRGEIDAALAAVVGRELAPPDGVPSARSFLTRSQRVSNRRLREAGGWAPRVHGATEGWRLAAEG